MKKNTYLSLGIITIILGYIISGLGFTMEISHPWNTSMFFGGFVIISLGIYLIARRNKNGT
jgi:hypothetical protein